MKPSPKTPLVWTLAAAGALALALSAQAALAQTDKADQTGSTGSGGAQAEAPEGNTVGGVVVQAPGPSTQPPIPADKKAAYDAEAAKAEAWRKYRQATPPLSEGTLGQAKGYPGLQTLLPQPEPPAETH